MHEENRLIVEKMPDVEWILCPTHYHGTPFVSTDNPTKLYLRELNAKLDSRWMLFFTGQGVVSSSFTKQYAEKLSEFLKGRKIVIWDNYPGFDSLDSQLTY